MQLFLVVLDVEIVVEDLELVIQEQNLRMPLIDEDDDFTVLGF